MVSMGNVAVCRSSGHIPKPLLVLIVSVFVVFICKAVLTASFLTLSRRYTQDLGLRHCTSNASNFLLSLDFRVHVLVAYVAIGRMSALYSLTFRGLLISRFYQIGILSLPNAAEASDIRLLTSLDELGTTLPRNTNSLTCLTLLPSSTTAWSLGDMILHFHQKSKRPVHNGARLDEIC